MDEVATGVQEILADMIAKDKETLTYVQSLWDNDHLSKFTLFSCIQSLLIIIFLLSVNLFALLCWHYMDLSSLSVLN